MPEGGVGEFVEDTGDLGAESADVDGHGGDFPGLLQLVEHDEDFLGLAESEDGDHHRASAGVAIPDFPGEAGNLPGPSVFGVARVGPTGGFDDQGIDVLVRQPGGPHQGLVLEVDVSGVEDAFSGDMKLHGHGSKDVSGIEKFGIDGENRD